MDEREEGGRKIEREREGLREGGRGGRWRDRKDCSCVVWRNSMLLHRHKGMDEREGGRGRD